MNDNSKNIKSETPTIFSENFSVNSKSAHSETYKKDTVGNVFCKLNDIKLTVCEVQPHYNKKLNKRYREMSYEKVDIPYKIIENSICDNILFECIRIADKLNCYGIKYTHHKNAPFVFYCLKDKGNKTYLYRVTLHNILRGELL